MVFLNKALTAMRCKLGTFNNHMMRCHNQLSRYIVPIACLCQSADHRQLINICRELLNWAQVIKH